MTKEYLGYDEGYRDAGWSKAGKTPSNENRARDKSGYKIPSPSEMLTNYYSKFPERVTDKLDNVYEKIIDVRDMLMAADFNKPLDKPYSRDVYSDAYREFSYVVQRYRSLFNYLDENRQLRGDDDIEYYIREFASEVRNIVSELKEIKDMIA